MRAIIKMIGLTSLAGLSLLVQAEPAPAAAPAEATSKTAASVVTGKLMTTSDEINYSGAEVLVDTDKGIITLVKGKVWVVSKKVTISADRMILTLNADLKPVKVEAIGNVVCIGKTVVEGKEIDAQATGGYGIYQVVEQVLTLTEKPRLIRGRSYLEGMEKLVYDKKTGIFKTVGGEPVGGFYQEDISKSKDDAKPAAGKLAEPAK